MVKIDDDGADRMAKLVADERRPRPFHDLREYLAAVKEIGQLKIVEGADGELEIGALTGIIGARKDCPVLLFDSIKGYSRGTRLMTNMLNNSARQKMIHGCPPEIGEAEAARWWNGEVKRFRPVPPVFVNDAPVTKRETGQGRQPQNLSLGTLARERRRAVHVRDINGDAGTGKWLHQCRLLSL